MIQSIPQIIENETQIFYGQKKKHDSEISVLDEQLSQKKAQFKELEIKLANLSMSTTSL